MNNEELVDMTEVDSNTWSSYTDDEGSESSPRGQTSPEGMGTGVWSKEEHTKFLEAIKIYANGPWKLVAASVGTRTVRQTMTHAQKYRQKAARRLRGLRTKQALMRMHFGHHVSEEFLMQERLRSMATNISPIDLHIGIALHSRKNCFLDNETLPLSKHFGSEPEAAPWVFSAPDEKLACLDEPMLDVEEIDLLEDLTAIPTLEECATELLQLLF